MYGNAFAGGSQDAVRRATTRIDPPTITNLIAMAAPTDGHEQYSAQQIEHVLTTAFTGFRAACLESRSKAGASVPVVVHTGFWGCGAFGGNRELMTVLQVLAGVMAGVPHLVFHTGDSSGDEALESARSVLCELPRGNQAIPTSKLIEQITAMGFVWGMSNGT